ncbi:hypothetical protein TKK_0012700 [Trichogramma kaykai]|uniref:BTB domain-containing protein n=1 Tax=Trichogramma kaykai TaxID=54128 RepID=A0ABD2WLS3_9HYME
MANVNVMSGSTSIDREDCQFTWTIKNINYKDLKEGESLESPIFSAACDKKFYFRLIAEKIQSNTTDIPVSIKSLYLCTKNILNEIRCDYRIIINVDGRFKTQTSDTIKILDADTTYKIKDSDMSSGYFWYENITKIVCNLTLSRGNSTVYMDSKSIAYHNKDTIPKIKFDWAFLDIELSDVKLRTASGEEIPAHRLILAAASPVFKAMFTHDMIENKNQLVDMADVSHETAVEMLRYIYTGSVANNETSLTLNLLAAADKYQLQDLKNKCEQQLSSNLSTKNVYEMLNIANMYSAKNLKKEAVDLVKRNINSSLDYDEISNMLLGTTLSVSK